MVKHQTEAEYPLGYICLQALLLCVPVGVKEKGRFYPTEKRDVLFLSFKSLLLGENFLFFSVMGSLRTTFFSNHLFNAKHFMKRWFFKHFHLQKKSTEIVVNSQKNLFFNKTLLK